MDRGWVHDIVQEVAITTIPNKKKCKKAKWLSEEALQIAMKVGKERCTHLNAEFQRITRRDKKVFLRDKCKEIVDNNRMGKTLHGPNRIRGFSDEVARIHRIIPKISS